MTKRKKRIILWSVVTALMAGTAAVLILCHICGSQWLSGMIDPIAGLFSGEESPPDPSTDTEAPPDLPESPEGSEDEAPVSDPDDQIHPQDQSASPPLLNIPPSACDPKITEIREDGACSVLTGGIMPVVFYLQGDERWGSLLYGSDPISSHGCGPTAMAMVVSTLTDTLIDPPSMAQWAVAHGYWARRSGSYHSIVIGTATAFGLSAESFPSRSPDSLREQLLSGNLLVALMGPGHFTQGGHFIILRGVTLSGEILVADPASAERSLTPWDAQLLLDELSSSTADGSPLWLISAPHASIGE